MLIEGPSAAIADGAANATATAAAVNAFFHTISSKSE
jgi:hypothetical protein